MQKKLSISDYICRALRKWGKYPVGLQAQPPINEMNFRKEGLFMGIWPGTCVPILFFYLISI